MRFSSNARIFQEIVGGTEEYVQGRETGNFALYSLLTADVIFMPVLSDSPRGLTNDFDFKRTIFKTTLFFRN